HHRLSGVVGSGARAVLDNNRLTDALRQPLPDEPRQHVLRAAGRNADDDPDGPAWIGLPPRKPSRGRPHGNACTPTQDLATGPRQGGLLLRSRTDRRIPHPDAKSKRRVRNGPRRGRPAVMPALRMGALLALFLSRTSL